MDFAVYQSHKRVQGFQIGSIYAQEKGTHNDTREPLRYIGGVLVAQKTEYVITSVAGEYTVVVGDDYYTKHEPHIGGYFVRYDNGYQSFSPADVFEDGYTKVASGFKWKTITVWPDSTSIPEIYPDYEIHTVNDEQKCYMRVCRGHSVNRVILKGGLQPADLIPELHDAIHNATRTFCHHKGFEIDWEVLP
jgi:hypothetical protein